MTPQTNNIGAYVAARRSVPPAAYSAGATNGTGVDRATPGGQLAQSCVMVAESGGLTGGPTTQTLDCKIQDSADNATFADYIPPRGTVVAAITQITAANTLGSLNIDLSSARRYIRAVSTVGFTGGASPTMGADAKFILGGADNRPVV